MKGPIPASQHRAAPAVPFVGPGPPGIHELRRRQRGPALARRVGHCPRCGLRDRKCPIPSDAVGTHSSGHHIPDSAPASRTRNDRQKHTTGMLRRHAVRHPADVVAARDATHAERRPRVRDAPTRRKGTPTRQKKTDSASETPKTPQGRYRASHTGRCTPTARPTATRTGQPQTLCSVRDIPH